MDYQRDEGYQRERPNEREREMMRGNEERSGQSSVGRIPEDDHYQVR